MPKKHLGWDGLARLIAHAKTDIATKVSKSGDTVNGLLRASNLYSDNGFGAYSKGNKINLIKSGNNIFLDFGTLSSETESLITVSNVDDPVNMTDAANKKYVVHSISSGIQYSTQSTIKFPIDDDWIDAAYINKAYIFLSSDFKIARSRNLIDFEIIDLRSLGGIGDWTPSGLCAGKNQILLYFNSKDSNIPLFYTSDGLSWARIPEGTISAPNFSIKASTFCNGTYYFFDESSMRYFTVSENLKTVTPYTLPGDYRISSCASDGNSIIVAVSKSGDILYDNGTGEFQVAKIKHVRDPAGGITLNDVTFSGNAFFVCGEYPTREGVIAISQDGSTWDVHLPYPSGFNFDKIIYLPDSDGRISVISSTDPTVLFIGNRTYLEKLQISNDPIQNIFLLNEKIVLLYGNRLAFSEQPNFASFIETYDKPCLKLPNGDDITEQVAQCLLPYMKDQLESGE